MTKQVNVPVIEKVLCRVTAAGPPADDSRNQQRCAGAIHGISMDQHHAWSMSQKIGKCMKMPCNYYVQLRKWCCYDLLAGSYHI